jgi:hypothetical protein
MIKLLIIIGAILLVLFWLFGSYLIKFQEWINEYDDQTKGCD